MPIVISQKGSFSRTLRLFKKLRDAKFLDRLSVYGQMGVDALRDATPKDTGKTSESWSYEIHKTKSGFKISWNNSNINRGINIAVLIEYGHATRGGGYVLGRDYINPAMAPIFEKIANDLWMEVVSD